MPGAITSLSKGKASGWAVHPYLSGYSVLIHVIYRTKILRSVVADQPGPNGEEEKADSWFNINLADLALPDDAVENDLAFLIGETDEYISVPKPGNHQTHRRSTKKLTIEDMIYANGKRPWVNGATFVEAERAGLGDAEIIDLLYRDLLGRPADPGGLANYIFQRRQGIRSFKDIRKSLIESDEYRQRPKLAAEAPGAVFSQGIVFCAASGSREAENTQTIPVPEESLPKHMSEDGSPAATRENSNVDVRPEPWSELPEVSNATHQVKSSETDTALEVVLPLDSVLFGAGWHKVEYIDGEAFRWMEKSSLLSNPKPNLSCESITLDVSAVYGAHEPMVDCYLEDEEAEVELRRKRGGFTVQIRPRDRRTSTFKKLRIESRASGCPLQDDRGSDERVLSLNLAGISIIYEPQQGRGAV